MIIGGSAASLWLGEYISFVNHAYICGIVVTAVTVLTLIIEVRCAHSFERAQIHALQRRIHKITGVRACTLIVLHTLRSLSARLTLHFSMITFSVCTSVFALCLTFLSVQCEMSSEPLDLCDTAMTMTLSDSFVKSVDSHKRFVSYVCLPKISSLQDSPHRTRF